MARPLNLEISESAENLFKSLNTARTAVQKRMVAFSVMDQNLTCNTTSTIESKAG